jgi:hypothetical protein
MKNITIIIFTAFTIVLSFNVSSGNVSSNPASMAFYVVPSNYAGTAGGSSFLGPLSNSQRTYQMLIHDTLLNSLKGLEINALTWRLLPSAVSNWPSADVTFANYDIYIGEGINPALRKFTFDSNYAVIGVKKRVRSGPLTITAGSFPFGGNPTTFGTDIVFDSTYIYNGGHLTIEIRHQGFTGTSTSVDAAGTGTPGYLVNYSACWVGNYTATTGGLQGNFCITRLNADSPVGVNNGSEVVKQFSLKQNYPNPFNPVTNIAFVMQKSAKVTLKIYDIAGNEVMALINDEQLSAGTQSMIFDASGLGSGVYFYTLYADNNKIDTKKMILVK